LPEWLLERGIGESRAARIVDGVIVEARIFLDGVARVHSRRAARLTSAGRPAIAVADGIEYLLPAGGQDASEGAQIVVEITREAIPGAEPWKRPLARMTDKAPGEPAPIDAELLTFPAPDDPLGDAGWREMIEEARSGVVRFSGGELRISPTPAMTLIDVDGTLPPDKLAVAGALAAARTILRLDIGGSIGIDLPTPKAKEVRQAAAAAVDAVLPKPFERTAVNGFGFLQIVRPRLRASLVELAADRPAFEARDLLRRSGREIGAIRLAAHPLVIAELARHPGWLDQLSRQVGGAVTLRSDASLAISGGHAEPA
jgi:hypothetical protein